MELKGARVPNAALIFPEKKRNEELIEKIPRLSRLI